MGPAVGTLFLFLLLAEARAQLVSPCPRLFSYEPQKENDRWYGVVTLISESDLSGVWLRLIFDRPSLQLGNWFGEISTTDNKEYLVKNRNHAVKANMPFSLRFYLKYNPADPAPQLITIRLNAKTVCPEGVATTQAPITAAQLITSNQIVESVTAPSQPSGSTTFVRPGGGWSPAPPEGDDDVFAGDFQLINRPSIGVPGIQPECGIVVNVTRVKRHARHYSSYFIDLTFLHFYQYMLLLSYNSHLPHYLAIAPLELQPRPLVVHGQVTTEGEFPWHAALYQERGADLQYICGGSLISREYVLTAAHCVTRQRSHTPINPDSLVVYLGKFYLRKWSNTGIQDTQLSKIISHPGYNAQTYANDIALIKLANQVAITDYVRPICLWEGENNIHPLVNTLGTVVGWGYDHTGKVTEILMQTKMPVTSKETCIYSFPDFFSRFTTENTYCAGFRNGTSVCNGDSGGGMVFPRPSTVQGRQVWQLRGLVSLSVALQNQLKCDASHYVVFTDVAKYLDWIKNTIST